MNSLKSMGDKQLYLAIQEAKKHKLDFEFIAFLKNEARRRVEFHKKQGGFENLEITLLKKVL
jgi:hypothetical protein